MIKIYCNKSYVKSPFQNILLYYTHPSCDDVWWGEGKWVTRALRRSVRLLLTFQKHIRRNSSAPSDAGSSSHDDVDGWMQGADGTDAWGSWAGQSGAGRRVIQLLRIRYSLELLNFLPGIFHLVFANHGWPQMTEATENETADKGGLLCECFHAS